MRFKPLLCVMLLCCLTVGLYAAEGGYTFLKVIPDARARALGGAFSASQGSLESVFHNPAGLLEMQSRSGYITSFSKYWEDGYFGSFAYVWEGNRGKWGAGMKYFNSGEMDQTYINSDGSFGGYGSDFAVSSGVLFLAFSHSLNQMLDFGLRPSLVWQNIDEESGFAASLDVSLMHVTPDEMFAVGAVLQNVGYSFQDIGEENENLPIEVRVGMGTTPRLTKYATLSAEVVLPQKNDKYFCGGIEIHPIESLSLQIGYNGLGQNWAFEDEFTDSMSFGFGYQSSLFNVHYAFEFCGEMDEIHTLQISKAIP